jgi:hypothetical protein
MSGLEKQVESAWPFGAVAAGEVPGALIRLFDGVWPGDGLPERRGGSVYKSSGALGSGGPKWIADRRLVGGQRTVFPSTVEVSSLAADDTSFSTLDLGTSPLTAVMPAVVRGVLFWGGAIAVPLGAGLRGWGGSRKTDYNAGTVQVTNESTTVTGAGTAWLANVDPGMILDVPASFGWRAVETVVSNTELRLTEPWFGDSTGPEFYTLRSVLARGGTTAGTISALGSVAGRLVMAVGTQARFSPLTSPFATWDATDQHSFPAPILGFSSVRDTLLAFTTEGAYAVYNMALNLTDAVGNPQQRVERISDELILWGQFGIASWRGSVIAPMIDGVWVVDAVGQPTKISGAIEGLYLAHVRAGNHPGVAAVYNGHYFLPILNSSGTPQDLFVCRLTANSAGRSMLWSQFRGHGGGGGVRGLAVRAPVAAGTTPLLLAAGEDGKISTMRYFDPQAAYKSDADGVAHQLEIQTRAYQTGGGVANTVRFVTLYYTLTDAASDDPNIDCSFAIDGATSWTAATAGGTGAESITIAKKTWRVDRDARAIQFRFRSNNAAATAKFRGLELQVHRSGRV